MPHLIQSRRFSRGTGLGGAADINALNDSPIAASMPRERAGQATAGPSARRGQSLNGYWRPVQLGDGRGPRSAAAALHRRVVGALRAGSGLIDGQWPAGLSGCSSRIWTRSHSQRCRQTAACSRSSVDRARSCRPVSLYVKLLPDGEPVALNNDSLSKMGPVFSPDGNRIAYTVN